MTRPIYALNVGAVTALAELALPHFAECRPGPAINALIWCENVRAAAATLLRGEPGAAELLQTPAYRQRVSLYHRAGERGADAAAMLAIIASAEAPRPTLRNVATLATSDAPGAGSSPAPAQADPIPRPDRDAAIATIRAELRRRSGVAWLVTGGRRSDWGWLTITAPATRRAGGDMVPADRAALAQLLGLEPGAVGADGISVDAAARGEYVRRAAGV